tara:strand:+ start:472 stop:1023 length:552 start_codon:yes stop_codon:yes gene_type:complete
MEIIFHWSFLLYPFALIVGIALHEPTHLLAAYIAGGKNIKIGIKNKGNLGFIKYDLHDFSTLKVRFVGLAPIITAAIVTIINFITHNRLEWYCFAFGLIIYMSWKDISVEAALTGKSKIQKIYHSVPKYIRIFAVSWLFWQLTKVLVGLAGEVGMMAAAVELGGQSTSLLTAYYATYLFVFHS